MPEKPSPFCGQFVRLTATQPEDAALFSQWSENYEYLRLLDTDYVRPLSIEECAERDKENRADQRSVEFRIRTLAENTLIGFVAIHSIEWNNQVGTLSLGIGDPAYWGRGYGTEALRLALRYAFSELNLYRVGLDVISYNTRAIHVYEKVGFQREGALRGAVLRDGRRYDLILMGLLQDEFLRVDAVSGGT